MAVVTMLLGLALVTPSDAPVLLSVTDHDAPCHAVVSSAAPDLLRLEASAEAVADDIRRYFEGLSVQVTPILQAAWHGQVHFCNEKAQLLVLQALTDGSLRTNSTTTDDSQLPSGAAELLTTFASPQLVQRLEAFVPASDGERVRKLLALEIVKNADPSGP